MLDKRSVNYHKEEQIFKKTEIVEFYWCNNSPNRFYEQQLVTEVELIVYIAMFLYLRNKYG